MFLLWVLFLNNGLVGVNAAEDGSQLWENLKPASSVNLAVLECGRALIGRPYLVQTLESGEPEHLILRFDGFDCVTFIETSLALALCQIQADPSFASFPRILTSIRYRSGLIDGYVSRLHYTSDWAYDNQQMGLIRDITRDLGGIRDSRTINFMSTHPKAYHALSDPRALARIVAIEGEINQRERYFLPIDQISAADGLIQDGDLIAITTQIPGLDISHTGIAIRQGKIHMLHASQREAKVAITAQPLAEYIKTIKKASGIMVFRPLPRDFSK